jgi:hypothetical protein
MTAPTEKTMNFGLRFASVFELNASGSPAASSATPYEGLQFKGSTAFELNIPDSRKITGLGEDGVTQVVYLPPNEAIDGKLNVEATDQTILALLDGTKIRTEGEATLMGLGTNRQGYEPQVALLLYQEAVGLETGKQYWHSYIIPSAKVVRKAHGMTSDKGVTVYQVAPNRTGKHLWEQAFTNTTEGFLSAQVIEAWSNNPLRVTTFLGDGVEDEFLFPTDFPVVDVASVKVYVNGVIATPTVTTTKITFSSAPADEARIFVLRDYAG